MAVARPAGDFDRTYQQDMAVLRQPWHWVLLVVALLVIATTPYWAPPYVANTANQIAYTVIALQGLNLLTGYTGQISLGQAAFMLVGGYTSALLVTHLGFSALTALPFAALGAGLVGLLFGLPSLRVKGFYLAMATLAAQFIIPWLTRHTFPNLLGGTLGQIEAPVPTILGYEFNDPSRYLHISLVVLLITTIASVNITRTRFGRALVAVRDNDLAAELLGVNLFGYKLRAFFIAAVFAGLAGALRAHTERSIGSGLGYNLQESIFLLGMLVIGGQGTNLGPFLGATFVIIMDDVARQLGADLAETIPPLRENLVSSLRPILFGLSLVLFLVFEPRGLAHRWRLFLAAWRLRPFSH